MVGGCAVVFDSVVTAVEVATVASEIRKILTV